MKKQVLLSLLIVSSFAPTLTITINYKERKKLVQEMKDELEKRLNSQDQFLREKLLIETTDRKSREALLKQLVKEALLLEKRFKIKRELTQLTKRVKDIVETCHTMEQKEPYLALFNASSNA
jgi:uncharacterized membrane protein affecting hemolysin expression